MSVCTPGHATWGRRRAMATARRRRTERLRKGLLSRTSFASCRLAAAARQTRIRHRTGFAMTLLRTIMRSFVIAGLALVTVLPAQAADAARPNFLFVYTDDQR